MNMQAVQGSSNIRAIGYDSDKRTMDVEFQGGSRYRYHNVPPEEHSNFLNSPAEGSHGKHFERFIKRGPYPYTKLPDPVSSS